jgi:hypothetical protein
MKAANTTVFRMADGPLLDLRPARDPARLMMFSEGRSFSYPHHLEYRDQTADVFEGASRSDL